MLWGLSCDGACSQKIGGDRLISGSFTSPGSVGEYFSLTSDNSIFDNSHSSAALNLKLEPGPLTQDFLTTAPEKSEKLSSDSSLPQ
jgi:hypothetical protein